MPKWAMRGAEGFEQFYSRHYGERWPDLKAALLASDRAKVWLKNPFQTALDIEVEPVLPGELPITVVKPKMFGAVAPSTVPLSAFYELDLASVFAAAALPLVEGEKWLDLCAAPGGKALAKIFNCAGHVTTVANDVSEARVQRLKAIFHDYLPVEVLARTQVVRRDATRWRAKGEDFAAVLVDAPCSSEHHLLAKPQELAKWSVKRSQGLAIRQHALLCAALEFLAPEGHLLYSTCSISPLENDAVVERFLDRRAGRLEVIEAPLWLGDRTPYGVEVFPDRTGTGPIYYCLLKKVSEKVPGSKSEKVPGSFSVLGS